MNAMTTELLNRNQAAAVLRVSPGTLANWQSSHFRRVPHVKLGRRVMYRMQDLQRFIESNIVDLPVDDNR